MSRKRQRRSADHAQLRAELPSEQTKRSSVIHTYAHHGDMNVALLEEEPGGFESLVLS